MTSTSNKLTIIIAATLVFTGITAASHNNGNTGSITGDITDYEGYGVPEYDTQGEVLTKLVAPFLLITLILQIGLQIALESTILRGLRGQRRRRKRKMVKKHSTIMALAIAGMTIPSPIFKYINGLVAALYGGITWLFLALVIGIVVWLIFSGLTSNGNRGE